MCVCVYGEVCVCVGGGGGGGGGGWVGSCSGECAKSVSMSLEQREDVESCAAHQPYYSQTTTVIMSRWWYGWAVTHTHTHMQG